MDIGQKDRGTDGPMNKRTDKTNTERYRQKEKHMDELTYNRHLKVMKVPR